MATITINSAEMANRIATIAGTIPVVIRTRTQPEMRKTGNPFAGRVWKVQDLQAMIGSWSYGRAVNARRAKEYQEALLQDENAPAPAEFQPLPRKWGQRVDGTPFVSHAGQDRHSVELSVQRCLGQVFLDDQGNIVPRELLEPFFPRREEGARQGLENPVILRDIKLENIVSVKYAGDIVEVAELAQYGPGSMSI